MKTVRYTLSGIDYEADLPDQIEAKHVAIYGPRLDKLPEGMRLSITAAALGMVHARASRVVSGKAEERRPEGTPQAYGTLRSHGHDPVTYGDAVERHFCVTQRVSTEDFWKAASTAFRAVLGLPPKAEEVDEALGNSEEIPTSA
jgi:hypothetical protein